MRQVCTSVVAVCLMATVSASAMDERAERVLSAARMAVTGATESGTVQRLTISGRGTRAIGPMQLAGPFELHLVLPDRAVRIDRLSVGGIRTEIASGFNGSSLIQRASGVDGVRMDPGALLPAGIREAAKTTAVLGARQDLGILLLGLFADSFAFYPMQFTYAGTADAPDGSADVILAQHEGFVLRLFVDVETRRPLMVSWNAPDVLGAVRQLTSSGRGTLPSAADIDALGRGPQVEHRLHFETPRRSGAITAPTVIRRTVAGETTEELVIERMTVNPTVDTRLFDAGR